MFPPLPNFKIARHTFPSRGVAHKKCLGFTKKLTENRELPTENCLNPPPQPADPEIFRRCAHTHPRNPPPDALSRSNPAPLLASNPASTTPPGSSWAPGELQPRNE